MRKLRLLLVDDHRLVRESLAAALQTSHAIVATAADGRSMWKALDAHSVDCVLLDLDLPGEHGLHIMPALRRRYPALRIVVVTMHADQLMATATLRNGADAFVPKDAGIDELQLALAEVAAGRQYVSPRLSAARHHVGLEAKHPGLHRLTPRQQEVLLLLGDGRSAASIAESLRVGQSTIAFHKQNIMRVLGLASGEALLQYAVIVRTSGAAAAGQ